jgi:hypothetical protein
VSAPAGAPCGVSVNAMTEPATASGIGGKVGQSRVEAPTDAKAMKANAALIATATSGRRFVLDVTKTNAA